MIDYGKVFFCWKVVDGMEVFFLLSLVGDFVCCILVFLVDLINIVLNLLVGECSNL